MAEPEFEIYIGSLTGKTIILYTNNDDTILHLKQKIFEKEGIPPRQQRLIFHSRNLYDENQPISHYGINAGSTLNLVISLAKDKSMRHVIDYKDEDPAAEDHMNGAIDARAPNQDSNKNWYYLQSVDSWKPFEPFISLLLCCRYNQNIRHHKFALFSSFRILMANHKKEGANAKRMRYLFQLNEDKPHQMYEPQHCIIGYGYIDGKTKHMIQCDIPPNPVINDEIELLYLLNTNQFAVQMESAQKEHLSLLPHPSNPFLFGTWFGQMIYGFEWMVNEEIKLRNVILKNNTDSLQFNAQYLENNNKKVFKQMIKNKCGIPFGVGHLLYNHLRDELRACASPNDVQMRPRSSNYVYQVIHQFFAQLKHKKITQIQIIFLQNEIHSTDFFNQYLKDVNPFISTTKLSHFLKHVLSLRSTQIQQLIPAIKSAFQIRVDDKYVEDASHAKYNIDARRVTLIRKQGNKAITSFNIWLPRNVIYSKKELIKQQHDVKRYIEQHEIGSQTLHTMQKKQFVAELHSKCQIPIGPLHLLYDNLPTGDTDECTANEIVEFISNYLYELRHNNIERIRDRCIASNTTDEAFAKTIAPNTRNELAQFLRDTLKMKSNVKINHWIPKIQQYAQNLYTDLEIVKHTNAGMEDEKQNVSTTFGTWLSELCFERNKLTKQQQSMERYITQMRHVESVKDMDEWELNRLWTDTLKLDPMDTAPLMNELYRLQETAASTTKAQVMERFKKILYDTRTKHMASVRATCNALAKEGIDDEYFIHEIVVNDVKLEKFLMHNIGMTRLSEIPQLIHSIRKHLEALHILNELQNEKDASQQNDNEEKDALRAQTIYGNKVGRWIGEIIHNRLIYLKHAKTLHDFVIINHWNSGILPHIGAEMFVHRLRRYVFGGRQSIKHHKIYNAILAEIWNRLERRYMNNPDAVHVSHTQIAQDVFEYMREIRRAYIYQIAVECSNDAQCVDAKTFYTKIGSNKMALRKFIHKILRNTNQEQLVMADVFGKEWLIEQIYYLLSVDVDDHNVSFEQWLSHIIYDPVSVWLNITQIQYFLAEENINAARAKLWGKKKFIQKACVPCDSLSDDQLTQLFSISKRESDKDAIFDLVAEKLRKQHHNKRTKCNDFIADKQVNKQSFVNVTAINVAKCIEFMDKDLGISYDTQRDLVTAVVERLRLCLKIHTNLLDNQLGDEYKDAITLFANAEMELKVEEKHEAEEANTLDAPLAAHSHSAWVQPNMLDIKELNHDQLALALCCALLRHKPLQQQITNIYGGLVGIICAKQKKQENERENERSDRFTLDGEYVIKYISSAKQQFDVDKAKQRERMKQRMDAETRDPWKYKQGIHELNAEELSCLMEQCLLNSDCIPYYKHKMENIAQKIIDANMNGVAFINNLNSNKNVFVHRMMQCFGDKSDHKLVQNLYDDIHSNLTLCDTIHTYDAAQLSHYLKTYQMNKVKAMMMDSKLDGERLSTYKRHEFAAKVKQTSDVPLGVATMLYKKMMTFEFMDPVVNTLEEEDETEVRYSEILRDAPSIEFVSLVANTLCIEDASLCNLFWNTFVAQYDEQKLQNMNEKEMMQSLYGYPMNPFHATLLSEINKDHGNKYTIAKGLIQHNFAWLKDDAQYVAFDHHFKQYIAEYFKSDLMLILMYKQKVELLKPDMVRFLLRLDFNHIHYDTLRGLKDGAIDEIIANHKKGFNAQSVEDVMREIKLFIRKEKKCHQNKKVASWKVTDIGLYVMTQLLNQIGLMRSRPIIENDDEKLCILDIVFCIEYFAVFIQEYVHNPSNDMQQLMERKARNETLYLVHDESIPQIVTDIFVSWIKKIMPRPSAKQEQGLFKRMWSTLSNVHV